MALQDYVDVATRLALFWQTHPSGRIATRLVTDHGIEGRVMFAAEAYANADDAVPAATGWASERLDVSGRTAEATNPVEVCETSAVGRALANWTFQASAKRPSREEMQSAARARPAADPERPDEAALAEASAVIDALRDKDPAWWDAEVGPKRDDLVTFAAVNAARLENTLAKLDESYNKHVEKSW